MTGMQSLEARAAVSVGMGVLTYIAATSPWIHGLSRKAFDRGVTTGLAVSRLSVYAIAFLVLHIQVRGDIPSFYVLPARGVFLHKMPYRDYPTSYAPLHPFLDAGLLLIWNSPLIIILFSIIGECFVLPVWMRVARIFASERSVRIASVLYLTSAASILFVAIDGQDNVLLQLLLGLALLALARYRAVLSGFLVAIGAVCVKFLPILFIPAFLITPVKRVRWFLAFLGTMIVGYGYFAWIRLPLLFPVTYEHTDRTASDLPFILEGVVGRIPPLVIEDAAVALALLAIVVLLFLVAIRRPSIPAMVRGAAFGCTALLLALLILSRKSWPPYVMLVLFPLCLLTARRENLRTRVVLFAVFNLICLTTHSIWATVFLQFLPEPFHAALLAGNAWAYILLVTQIALIAGYCWLLAECIAELRIARAEARQGSRTADLLLDTSR